MLKIDIPQVLQKSYQEIYDYCMSEKSCDPMYLAQHMMTFDSIPMHGPQHHFLVPAAMLTAFNNKYGDKEQLQAQLNECAKRAQSIPGGYCSIYGVCGAGIGIGIFYSVITNNKPMSTQSWKDTAHLASSALASIALHRGPRCCKRDSFMAILSAVSELEKLNINLPVKAPVLCNFYDGNKTCIQTECSFYIK